FLTALITHLDAAPLPFVGRTHIHKWIRAFGQYMATISSRDAHGNELEFADMYDDYAYRGTRNVRDVIKMEISNFILYIPHQNLPKWHAFCRTYR
ncbi:MAG: hypothetical protein KBD15_02475, partial [Candidatus Magasanikbacteria bacterium]|nr:hypothetical protein [Candidatus Magasanikbacteria bacterium]